MKQLHQTKKSLLLCMLIAPSFFLQSCTNKNVTGKFEIDVSQRGAIISPDLFGHNLEHTRKGIWQGISAQMIANRKFAAVKGDMPERWKAVAYSGKAVADRNTVFVGNHSVRFENKVIGKAAIAQQHEWLTFTKGTKYVFRVWIKSDSELTLWLGIRDSYSARPWVIREETISRPGDWQLWTGEFIAPMTLKSARFEIGSIGDGTSWIGAVSLMPANNFHGMRADVIEKLKVLKPGNLRWPGGCFAEYYVWEDGLLPVDQRPPLGPAVWAGLLPDTDDYDNHEIGIDEYIALCRELNCEPNITIPYGRSNPERAASWVEYCNGNENTHWGKIRSQRGHPGPYNVRRWYVGNEIWGLSLVEDKNPERCAIVSTAFIKAMKESDPNIQIVGCAPNSYPEARPVWLTPLMREAGDLMDIVQIGWYFPEWAGIDDVLHAPVRDILPMLRSMRHFSDSTAQSLSLENKAMVIYEWNMSWGLSGDALTGIFAAGMLNMFCREAESFSLEGASYFMPVNEGAIRVGPVSCSFETDGEVFQMYASHQNNYLLHLPESRMELLNIDACASLTPDNKMVYVTIVSHDTEKDRTIEFGIENARITRQVQSMVLIPLGFEPVSSTFRKEEEIFKALNNKVKIVIPPGSITRLCFELKN